MPCALARPSHRRSRPRAPAGAVCLLNAPKNALAYYSIRVWPLLRDVLSLLTRKRLEWAEAQALAHFQSVRTRFRLSRLGKHRTPLRFLPSKGDCQIL